MAAGFIGVSWLVGRRGGPQSPCSPSSRSPTDPPHRGPEAAIRRLPLLHTGLVSIAVIYLYRATVYDGIAAVRDGDTVQIVFAAIALLIGLAYAYGAFMQRRPTPAPPAAAL